MLEEHEYRVCYPDRDFPVGGNLSQQVNTAIADSHRVIVIITR